MTHENHDHQDAPVAAPITIGAPAYAGPNGPGGSNPTSGVQASDNASEAPSPASPGPQPAGPRPPAPPSTPPAQPGGGITEADRSLREGMEEIAQQQAKAAQQQAQSRYTEVQVEVGEGSGADVSITSPVFDPLEALLGADALEAPTDVVNIRRPLPGGRVFAMDLEVCGLWPKEYRNIVERHTRQQRDKATGEYVTVTDNTKAKADFIVAGTRNLDWVDNAALYERFKVSPGAGPRVLIEKVLLPLEIDRIATTIMDLSGGLDESLVNTAGN